MVLPSESESNSLRNGIVPIILFENLQIRFAARIPQNHRSGLEMRSGFDEAHIVHTLFQVDWNGVADDREVLIVNRERGLAGQERRGDCDGCSRGR
jgi:hypothetical protein